MKKEILKIKEKKWFDCKVETMVPATIHYRILAEDEMQAIELIKNKLPNKIDYKFVKRRDIKIMIYDAGSCILRFIKALK